MFKKRKLKEGAARTLGSVADDGYSAQEAVAGLEQPEIRAPAGSKYPRVAKPHEHTESNTKVSDGEPGINSPGAKRKLETTSDALVDVTDRFSESPSINTHAVKGSKDGKAYTGTVKTNRFGPIVETAYVRSSMAVDFQPDVCKDYKQTGYCGYGDNCKFLHIREDYDASWQIDNKLEKDKQERQHASSLLGSSVSEEDQTTCPACKLELRSPMKLKCGHLMCEACFIKRSKKSTKCLICGKEVGASAVPVKLNPAVLKAPRTIGTAAV